MRRLVLAILGLLVAVASFAKVPPRVWKYANPILHQDWSDPDVCRVGDDFYMTASSFNCFPGLPILHSRDLVHWQQIGAALTDYPGPGFDGLEDDFHKVQHGNGVWAPAIRYHDGWFYIFCGDPDRGIFMVRSQDPSGTWEAPVWVVKEKGFIDPCPLWDDNGNAWLSHGCAGSRAGLKSVLFVVPMSPDGTRLLGPSRIVYDGHMTQPTIEGTKFHQKDGHYYIFAPAGGVSTGWQTVLRSDSPYGPYEERIVMAASEESVANGPHQGAWVTAKDGKDWFMHFQDKGAYGRIVHLQPMVWGSDGWPVIGNDPDGDGCGEPVAIGIQPVQPTTVSEPQEDANYPSVSPYGIGWDWQYPSVPSPYWHQALPEDGIRLYSVQQSEGYRNLWDCPNLLQQKFSAESFSVTAQLVFRPNPQLKEKGEQAGFVVMGTDYAGIRLTDSEEGIVLEWISCFGADKGSTEGVQRTAVLQSEARPVVHDRESRNVPSVSYPDFQETTLFVRLDVSPRSVEGNVPDAECRFLYSLDGKKYVSVGETFIAKPGRWIGAKWGFFCNRFSSKNDSGSLDIKDCRQKYISITH